MANFNEMNFFTSFTTKVVGVTYSNEDGTNRQDLISELNNKSKISLVREYDNENDKDAIAVFNDKGNKLGYLPSDPLLANHIDGGGAIQVEIIRITGGPTLLNKLFKQQGKFYGLVIKIYKGDPDWKIVSPIMDEDREIGKIVGRANNQEKTKPDLAIKNYEKAINLIIEFDSKGIIYKAWRRTHIPIDRITLLLEKQKRFDEALNWLNWYFNYDDDYRISSTAHTMIEKRFERLKNK
ncbi:MAG: hypothetical protein HQ565_12605 [Bacteroidetes bacterium]|nr:hypothetical protein [Bacteroidota bacterium]